MIKNILVALPWYNHKLHRGLSRFAAEHHWHLNADWSRYRVKPSEWSGDGIISQGLRLKDFVEFMQKQTVPIVTINPFSFVDSPKVYDPDDFVVKVAHDYFTGKGFASFVTYNNTDWVHSRVTAFNELMNTTQNWHDALFFNTQVSFDERCEAIANFLKKAPRPLAVFCPNDEAGAEFILIATKIGIKIPQDVAVLGVHNDELTCESTGIPLSSIDCGLEEMGYQAGVILNKILNGEEVPDRTEIKTAHVVTRASTDTLVIENFNTKSALEFIQKNFTKPITIEDIARAGSLSVRGIRYNLKNQLDTSPAKELSKLRFNHAKKLLLTTQWPLDIIAKESGYQTVRSLYRDFEKNEKSTPDGFRKRFQQLN